MAYVPPHRRRTNAATALLATPGPYDADPIFVQVPQDNWAQRGYQYTLTVQWSGVPIQGLTAIKVRAHVHYRWQPGTDGAAGQWVRFAGNAWISGVDGWQTQTTNAVVAMAPANPPDVNHHP